MVMVSGGVQKNTYILRIFLVELNIVGMVFNLISSY